MPEYKSLNADSLSYEELMKNLKHNYTVGASEVVAEIDKHIFERAHKLAKEKEWYEITVLKANTPDKQNVVFTPEALANAVENYNKTHEDSRLFINAEGNLAMSTYSYGEVLEDGTVVEDE